MYLLKNFAFSANDNKRIQSVDSIERYVYGLSCSM